LGTTPDGSYPAGNSVDTPKGKEKRNQTQPPRQTLKGSLGEVGVDPASPPNLNIDASDDTIPKRMEDGKMQMATWIFTVTAFMVSVAALVVAIRKR
jgi:hypothetical protein